MVIMFICTTVPPVKSDQTGCGCSVDVQLPHAPDEALINVYVVPALTVPIINIFFLYKYIDIKEFYFFYSF